jgi:hypothetical protein
MELFKLIILKGLLIWNPVIDCFNLALAFILMELQVLVLAAQRAISHLLASTLNHCQLLPRPRHLPSNSTKVAYRRHNHSFRFINLALGTKHNFDNFLIRINKLFKKDFLVIKVCLDLTQDILVLAQCYLELSVKELG